MEHSKDVQDRLAIWAGDLAKTHADYVFNIETSLYKLLTILTAGAVFLSAAFINQIVSLGGAVNKGVLILSWIVYALNLAWICYGIMYSAKFKDDVAGIFLEFQIYRDVDKFFQRGKGLTKRTWKLYFNVGASVAFFMVGTGLLIGFIAINQF